MTKWRARRIAIKSAKDGYESGLFARRWDLKSDPRTPDDGEGGPSQRWLAVWRVGHDFGFDQGRAGNPETPVTAEVLAEAERVAKLSDRDIRLL